MDLFDQFVKPKKPAKGQTVTLTNVQAGARLTLQVGKAGPEAEAAARALAELGRRAKVGKRNGASAVVKSIRA